MNVEKKVHSFKRYKDDNRECRCGNFLSFLFGFHKCKSNTKKERDLCVFSMCIQSVILENHTLRLKTDETFFRGSEVLEHPQKYMWISLQSNTYRIIS